MLIPPSRVTCLQKRCIPSNIHTVPSMLRKKNTVVKYTRVPVDVRRVKYTPVSPVCRDTYIIGCTINVHAYTICGGSRVFFW